MRHRPVQWERIGLRLAVIALSVATFGCRERVDLLVTNANVYTVDESVPRATAFAVHDGSFISIGTDQEVTDRYSSAKTIDAQGATLVPGLIDSHGHLVNYGLMKMRADLAGTRSMDEVVARLIQHEASLPEDEWLFGRGWDQNDWPDPRYPTRSDIDSVFGDRPVVLERIDGHASLLNSAALRFLGIDADGRTPDPEGGRIVRDASGQPTGLLVDTAADWVDEIAPPPSEALIEKALLAATTDAASFGLTGVHEAGMKLDTLRVLRRLVAEDRIQLRVYVMTESTKNAFDEVCGTGLIVDEGDMLTVRSVKLYSDGALGSRGAALLEDYSDEAGNRGLMRTDRAELAASVEEAVACGFQPAVHAIGDAATRTILDIYDDLSSRHEVSVLRPRIEHAQVVSPPDIPRFAALGVIAAMQPTHATSDMYWAEDRVGPVRIEGAYAWQTLLDTGARMPFGSDFPVESMDPLTGFYAAVTRMDAEGFPEGGWRPHERVSREQALRGFTIEGAYAGFSENDIGSISIGKRADFVLLDRDIMTIAASEILQTGVIATFLGGRQVYGEIR